MARLILIQVKDNEVAEAIVKLMMTSEDVHKEGWGDHVASLGTMLSAYGKVKWMIAQPLSSCKCRSPQKKQDKSMDGFAKTKRYGWWVHKRCNKPTTMVVRNFVKNLLNGSNDLIPELLAQHEADVHIMPGNGHIKAGPPERENHAVNVLTQTPE